jgi:hypothetical protein
MAMSSEEKFKYWLDAAQLDMRTAEAMLDKGWFSCASKR